MKSPGIKYVLLLPVLLFSLYALLTIIGCVSCLLGTGAEYYCNQYYLIAKLVLALVISGFVLSFVYSIYKESKIVR